MDEQVVKKVCVCVGVCVLTCNILVRIPAFTSSLSGLGPGPKAEK